MHVFETDNVKVTLGAKVRCKECGGSMSLVEANQYVRGFVAAGGDPFIMWATWGEPGEEMQCRCPQCLGKCYVEPRPNDYHDCDLCECTGNVIVSKARNYLKGIRNVDA